MCGSGYTGLLSKSNLFTLYEERTAFPTFTLQRAVAEVVVILFEPSELIEVNYRLILYTVAGSSDE